MTHYFPAVPLDQVPKPALSQSPETLRPLVLVVDDEPIITDTLAAILEGHGLAVMTAYDGLAALELAMLAPPEILVTDLNMPGLDGVELARRVRDAAPDCGVIIFSGQASGGDLLACVNELDHNVVTLIKPVHPADLLAHVTELLAGRGQKASGLPRSRKPAPADFMSAEFGLRTLSVTVRQRLRPFGSLA